MQKRTKILLIALITMLSILLCVTGIAIALLLKSIAAPPLEKNNLPAINTPTPVKKNPSQTGTMTSNYVPFQSEKYNIGFLYEPYLKTVESDKSIYVESEDHQRVVFALEIDLFDQIYTSVKNTTESDAKKKSVPYLVSEENAHFGLGEAIEGKKLKIIMYHKDGSISNQEIYSFQKDDHTFSVTVNIDEPTHFQTLHILSSLMVTK